MRAIIMKILLITALISLLSVGSNSSHANNILFGYDGSKIDYNGNFISHQIDHKQNSGVEHLIETLSGLDVKETSNISLSDTLDESRNELVFGPWTSTQKAAGISWKASGYWQLFALNPNICSGTWNLSDLCTRAGRQPELSTIKGFIAGAAIKDPASMLLLGLGLIGICGLGRRRLLKTN
jgi:hypothetical protein